MLVNNYELQVLEGGLTSRYSILLLYLGLPVPGPCQRGRCMGPEDRGGVGGEADKSRLWDFPLSAGKQGKSRGALFVTHGTNNANAPPLDTLSHRRDIERERQPGCHKLHNQAVK